jgi:hypothetical protein
LLLGCREERADHSEIVGALLGAEATRDLLPQLHHAPVAFGLVVGEWNTRIMKEAQHIVFSR